MLRENGGSRVAVLFWSGKSGLTEEMTFELRLTGRRGISHAKRLGRLFIQDRG